MKKLRYRLLISVNGKWVKLSNTFNLLKKTPCINTKNFVRTSERMCLQNFEQQYNFQTTLPLRKLNLFENTKNN